MGILTKDLKYTIFKKINKGQLVEIQCDNCPMIFSGRFGRFAEREKTYCMSCSQKLSPKHIASRKKNTNPTHTKYWISLGYSIDEARAKVAHVYPKNKEFYLHKGYSGEDAERMAKEYKHPCSYKKEYWVKKGLSEEAATDAASAMVNKLRARLKKNFSRDKNRLCVEYWQKRGLSEDEAKEAILKIQHGFHAKIDRKQQSMRQKEAYNLLSQERKNERREKMINGILAKNDSFLTITPIHKEYWLKRGLEFDEAKAKAYLAKKQKIVSGDQYSSKLEKKFKDLLLPLLTEEQKLLLKENKFLTLKSTHRRFCPDLRIGKKVIEIFGGRVHLDARFYGTEDKNPWGKSFEETKRADAERITLLNKDGYDVLVLWEYDINNDIEGCMSKVKEFLNENQES